MWQRECRLSRAAKYFGGGEEQRQVFNTGEQAFSPKGEQRALNPMYDWQIGQRQGFANQDPLLSRAQIGAQDFWSQFPAMQQQLQGYTSDVGGYRNQVGGLIAPLQGQLGRLDTQLGGNQAQLNNYLAQVNPTILSHGALNMAQERDVAQRTRGLLTGSGTVGTTGAIGTELLNRDAYQQQRFNTALQQGQGINQQLAGLTGQRAGLAQSGTSLVSGLLGQQANLTGQQAGLVGQQQSMQGNALNQLLGTAGSITSNFTGTTNPILSYVLGRSGQNIQSQVDQAKIAAGADAASKGASGSIAGGGISLLGAAIPAIIGL